MAISLNAADDATRSRLMPINQKYPIADLLDACARAGVAVPEEVAAALGRAPSEVHRHPAWLATHDPAGPASTMSGLDGVQAALAMDEA